MLHYPEINPVLVQIYGPLAVRWYGLMYLVGFLLAYGLLFLRIGREPRSVLDRKELADLLFYAALGVIVGGRLGYMLFYEWHTLLQSPLQVFAIWQGGMSFHGGLVGVLLVLWAYARRKHCSLLALTDRVAPVVPLGLAAGRIGNFINGELWGRITTVPWGMVFPGAGSLPRHPSQLYECVLEGGVLFVILWVYSGRKRPLGAVSALFLFFYGLFRFGVEFFREPDFQKGFVAFGWMTEGQLLSLPMMLAGVLLYVWAIRRR